MALVEFLKNVRTAASFLSPRVNTGDARRDREFQRVLRGAAIWLTPQAVKGFDSEDLMAIPNLAPEQKQKLETRVSRFKELAETVPEDQPARPEQVREAFPQLVEIMEILKPYLDNEAIRAHHILLDAGSWPDYVVGFLCESGVDSDGEPCLWVWVIAEDSAFDSPTFFPESLRIQDRILALLQTINRWVFVRFRSISENEFFSTDDE